MGSRDIKIDITRGEKLEFAVEERKIFNTYSDIPEESFSLPCYSLAEILIEKMAALMGRTEARDFYDFWYLLEMERLNLKEHSIEFESKAKHKGHDPKEFASKVQNKESIFKRDWEKKLLHQIHDLPKFEEVIRKTKKYLK